MRDGLREHRRKLTRPRRAVLDIIAAADHHLTPAEISSPGAHLPYDRGQLVRSEEEAVTVTEDIFDRWKNREATAEAMIPIIGKLQREKDLTILLHSRSLMNKSAVSILKIHRFARQIEGEELSVVQTMPFLEAIADLDVSAAKIDLALLLNAYKAAGEPEDIAAFTAGALAGATGGERKGPQDVVLYGFGRIGRLVARLLVEKTGSGNGLRLRAVVVRKGGEGDLAKRASLLRRDSIHGQFNGSITVDEERNVIIANGNEIQVIYSNSPDEVDYTAYGIDDAILIDNTGRWPDREGLSQHLRPGVKKVLLTAPGKGDVPNIVHGINHLDTDLEDAVTVVEWGAGLAEGLAESRLEIRIVRALTIDELEGDEDPRRVEITPVGPRWHDLSFDELQGA